MDSHDRLTNIWESDLSVKILSSCSRVSTNVWMHHLKSIEMSGKKARWELHKNSASCFEQVLRAAVYKRVVVQPLTFHLPNHPRHTGFGWGSTDKLTSDIFLWIYQYWAISTYTRQLGSNNRCRLEDMPWAMTDSNGWLRICVVDTS